MKHKIIFFTGGFLFGVCCIYILNRSLLGDTKTMARLYPATLGLMISHDVRVLNALQSNELPQARNLLRQEIDSAMNSLLGVEKIMKLDDHSKGAVLLGQEALKSQ